jgi:putative hydrolase of the HAD superfamily
MSPDAPLQRRFDLLVLDYGGVCTLSHRELADGPVVDPVNAERDESLRAVLAAQAAGLKVVILSNEVDRAWAEHSPVLAQVDHILPCTDNGILKPDRRAYQRALLVTGCRADRSLFVDDEIDNVRGAQAAGLEAILFDITDPTASWHEIREALSQP